jgi:hypothetical protein
MARGKVNDISEDHGFVRVAPDGDHFIFQDGTSFYAYGVNYEGRGYIPWGGMWSERYYNKGIVEEDFIRTKDAGFNSFRILLVPPLDIVEQIRQGDFSKLDFVMELAEKYRIYLIIQLWWLDFCGLSLDEAVEIEKAIAARYRDEHYLIGYDLMDDAFIRSNIIVGEGDWRGYLRRKYDKTEELGRAWASTSPPFALSDREDIENVPFPDQNNLSPRWHDYSECLRQGWERWMRAQVDALKLSASNHLVTLSYNPSLLMTTVGLDPANRMLDFVTFDNLYTASPQYLEVQKALFPGKPLICCEIGLSNKQGGLPWIQTTEHATASNEMAKYLYMVTRGFAGTFKWCLNDIDPKYLMLPIFGNSKAVAASEGEFGAYRLDGSPKRFVYATRALGEYLRSLESLPHRPKARIQIIDNEVFRNQNATEYAEQLALASPPAYSMSTAEGEIAIYAASSFGSEESEARLKEAIKDKLVLVVGPNRRLIDFAGPPRSRDLPFDLKPSARYVYRINGKGLSIGNPDDAPTIDSRDAITLLGDDRDGSPLITRLGNFVCLPHSRVLSQLPRGLLDRTYEALGIVSSVGSQLQLGYEEELPLKFAYETDDACFASGRRFEGRRLRYESDEPIQVWWFLSGGRAFLSTTGIANIKFSHAT